MRVPEAIWQLLATGWQLLPFGNCLATAIEFFQWLNGTSSCQLATAQQLLGNCLYLNVLNNLEQLPSCQPIHPPTGGVRARPKDARTPHPGAWLLRRVSGVEPAIQNPAPKNRTTTESSAKNRSAAALTTTNPSTEIIMAETSLTTPAGDAMPLAITVPPRPGGTLLALDLGTVTGFAVQTADGAIVSGTVSFRPSRYDGGGIRYLRFRAWLDSLAGDAGGLGAVHFEEVRSHAGTDAAHIYGGFLATLSAWCEQRGIAYQGVPVGTIKRHVTGKGNADKAAVIAAIKARGHNPTDDNEADALAILLWVIETGGGVR